MSNKLYLPALSGLPHGYAYVELLIVIVMSSMITLALMGLLDTASESNDTVRTRNDLLKEARFAMQQMTQSAAATRRLLLPFNDNPYTDYPEHIREQTIPPSAPIGSSTFASAVLAVTLPANIDLDADGTPDADNDGDGQLDEDLPEDIHNDNGSGVYNIDDDGDGNVDNSIVIDDDERLDLEGEDPINGIDDDGDNKIDEDPSANMNEDGCPGFCGVDDDADGSIDEGSVDDDDEDGSSDEDWYDPVVFYLAGDVLKQRMPVPWDENGDSTVNGRDFLITDLARNVTRLRIEKLDAASRYEQVQLTLELTDPVSAESVSLQTIVRDGGAL